MRNTTGPANGKLVFEITGKSLSEGRIIRERLVAGDERGARRLAESRGMAVETVTCEGEPLTSRRKRVDRAKRDYTETIIATVVILIVTPIIVLGTIAVRWDYLREEEKQAAAEARIVAERGPEWREAVAFADGAIPLGSDGVGWFITRGSSGDSEVRYNAATAEYRIRVHTYPRGKNPLNASLRDRLEGGLIVRGSGRNWSVVKLDPFGW